MRVIYRLLILLIVQILLTLELSANIILVDSQGGGVYLTIQEGINAVNDGDTVLVQVGDYHENINYNGKNITIASEYIFSQNTVSIDSTIINGSHNGSVVTFENGEDSTTVLCGFTITCGSGTLYHDFYCGGGIYSNFDSHPTIKHCFIKNNAAEKGAGIWCKSDNIHIENSEIKNNIALYGGGGIYANSSNICLKANNIYHNEASCGGGICFYMNCSAQYDSTERCNIYENYAGSGSDIYATYCDEIYTLTVDTFTVSNNIKDFFTTSSSNNLIIDILNSKITPINSDLYVNPNGNDNNSGLTYDDPYKTISYALMRIASYGISTQLNTIHLAEGIYSPLTTGERLPLNMRSYIALSGMDEGLTILDGDNLETIITCSNGDSCFLIENLTVQNAEGIYANAINIFNNSHGVFNNLTIKNNTCLEYTGAGVSCYKNCNPIFKNVKFIHNHAVSAAAFAASYNCNPVFINTVFLDNHSGTVRCLFDCNPIFINSLITKGTGKSINIEHNCCTTIMNTNLCHNNSSESISLSDSSYLTIRNSILWNNTNAEIGLHGGSYDPCHADIDFCDIKGGQESAVIHFSSSYNWGDANITLLPQFIDTLNGNYQLLSASPCIDAGTPDTTGYHLPIIDLAGNPRIYNQIIDIGAYEWQGYGIDDPYTTPGSQIYLLQNSPNPFKKSTTISFISVDFDLIKDYELSIYNVKGQLIKTVNYDGNHWDTIQEITWDGYDTEGNHVPTGLYYYKLKFGDYLFVKKMIKID